MNEDFASLLSDPGPVVAGELLWAPVPQRESDMTLLPDAWGPSGACPHSGCGAAWLYVEAVGLERPPPGGAQVLGTGTTLRGELWVHHVTAPRAGWAKARCARVVCAGGHRTRVWDDGCLEPQPGWCGALAAQVMLIGGILAVTRAAMGQL